LTSLTKDERSEIIRRVLKSYDAAAYFSDYPEIVRQIRFEKQIWRKAVEDPVFFAVLFCNQKWLLDPRAEMHRQILRDPGYVIILVCGRGWGKTLIESLKFLHMLFVKPRMYIVIISAGMRQSMEMFSYLENHTVYNLALQDLIMPRGHGTTRTQIMLKEPWRSKVQALPCAKDKIRCKHPDALAIDEASIVPSEMITGELMMLLTKDNSYLFMSGTPKAEDHSFKRMYDAAKEGKYHAASYDSPLVGKEALDRWRDAMTQDEWEREVEAIWTTLENTYYPMELIVGNEKLGYPGIIDGGLDIIDDIKNIPPEVAKRIEQRIVNRAIFGGLDPGKERDYAGLALVYLDADRTYNFFLRQFPLKTRHSDVIAYVQEVHKVFPMMQLAVDQTGGASSMITEQLIELGIPTEGITLTEPAKEEIWHNLKLLSEQGRALTGATKEHVLITQMHQQQAQYSKSKGADKLHVGFYHPTGAHDDVFCAYALAVWIATKKKAEVTGRPIARSR